MYSFTFINPHLIRTFIKPLFAIIALLVIVAPAGAQTESLSPPSNVRFSADGRTVSWNSPAGLVSHYRINYGWAKGEIGELHDIPLGNVTSFRIPDFDPSATWQARVWAIHAVDRRLSSWYGPWVYWHPPTDTPTPVPPTDTPSPVPRDTDPPPRDTEPPRPEPEPEPEPCRKSCSASSGVWTVTEERTEHDGPVCSIRTYQRKLQQYTCTWNRSECGQPYNENRVVEDWKEIGRRGC